MESLLNNKIFIKVSIALVCILSVIFVVRGISEIYSLRYLGDYKSPTNITVSGYGEVFAVPDIATIQVSLSYDGKTSKEAQDLLNESITKTLDYLKNQNIEDKDVKSEYGGLNPKYSYETYPCYSYPCPSRDPKIIGYSANQSITIKIREVDGANEIRTGLAGLGITNISGPTFSIENEDNLKDEARGKAIEDAKEKAMVLAKQLGSKLGGVVSFSEGNDDYPMMYGAGAMMKESVASSAPAPELPKGENKIISNVTIIYEIK